jgi:hypothetical protein
MKPCLFPPDCVAIVVNSMARLLTRLARPKIHRSHLARYGLGLVLDPIPAGRTFAL